MVYNECTAVKEGPKQVSCSQEEVNLYDPGKGSYNMSHYEESFMSGPLGKVVIVNYSFMLDCIALHDSEFYISAPREKRSYFSTTKS